MRKKFLVFSFLSLLTVGTFAGENLPEPIVKPLVNNL
jgi:hypothetical protein